MSGCVSGGGEVGKGVLKSHHLIEIPQSMCNQEDSWPPWQKTSHKIKVTHGSWKDKVATLGIPEASHWQQQIMVCNYWFVISD